MRLTLVLVSGAILAGGAFAQNAPAATGDSWKQEINGQAAEAQRNLERAASATPPNPAAIRAYAEFLERYQDPAARAQYERLARLLDNTSAPEAERAQADRRLAALDLAAGDRDAAARHLAAFTAAGGAGWSLGSARPAKIAKDFIQIPGPSTGFARLAALAPDTRPEDLLPALARNVVTNGYQTVAGTEGLEQTEYLKLVVRYLVAGARAGKAGRHRTRSAHRDLRFHRHRRSAARAGVSHARRLRLRCGAGNGQRVARVSDHRFRLPAGATGAGSAR